MEITSSLDHNRKKETIGMIGHRDKGTGAVVRIGWCKENNR